MNLGNAIRKVRKNEKQISFAKDCEITQTYLSQIETCNRKPSLDVLDRISKHTNIPIPIILWYALEEIDIKPELVKEYRAIRLTIDSLIETLI